MRRWLTRVRCDFFLRPVLEGMKKDLLVLKSCTVTREAEWHASPLCFPSASCILLCSKTALVNQPVFCWFLALLKWHPWGYKRSWECFSGVILVWSYFVFPSKDWYSRKMTAWLIHRECRLWSYRGISKGIASLLWGGPTQASNSASSLVKICVCLKGFHLQLTSGSFCPELCPTKQPFSLQLGFEWTGALVRTWLSYNMSRSGETH